MKKLSSVECLVGLPRGLFTPPLVFTFDGNGDFYGLGFNGIFTFDLNSNLITLLAEMDLDVFTDGITYDFDHNRILLASGSSSLQNLIAIDIETQEVTTLFSFDPPGDCNAKAFEYVGNNTLIVSGGDLLNNNSNCGIIYSIDTDTQEVIILFESDYPRGFADFLFIEDEIENVTLSTSTLTCDNIGENTITVTQLIDDTEVTCEVIVTVQSTFEFINCPIFSQLDIDEDSEMAIIPDLTQNLDILSSCNSDFEITQDIAEGTLIPAGQEMQVIITATNELGQVAQCFVTVSSDSTLDIEEISLDKDITIYPNPTQGTITLQNNNNIPLTEVVIYDSIGRIINSQQINGSSTALPLSLEAFTEGIYFVRISTNEASTIKRIVKQ